MMRNMRTVDLAALENNMRLIRSAVPSSSAIMAVVKADGYGHGAAETAQAALRGGAKMLAVATADEGVALRKQGIGAPILVLGAATQSDAHLAARYDLTETVCSPEMVSFCEQAASSLNKQTEVHLKIDTGMGRIGVRNDAERDQVLDAVGCSEHVRLTGAFTHFSDADGGEEGIAYTQDQFRQFIRMTEGLPAHVIRHCCNSAAIHRFPEMALDMVRAGISLYGYPPVPVSLPLRPCLSWTALVTYVKELPPGSYVSYGRTCLTDRTVRVATVACGYGDGYHRNIGGKGYVLIHGQRASILGRICMDQMMVDVSRIEGVCPGDTAILIGREGNEFISAEDLASWSGTISYEILLSSGPRVERNYVYTDGKEANVIG